jgi:hypothetical protein
MSRYSSTADVAGYPEVGPYDMDPPLYNLIPEPEDVGEYDTPGLIAAALAIAKRVDINPFCTMYGSNPLKIHDRKLYNRLLKLNSYRTPHALPKTSLPNAAAFVEQLNPTGNTPVFRVLSEGKELLLKVVRLAPTIDS